MIKAVIFDLWGVLATKKHWLFNEIRKDLTLDKRHHPYFVELLWQMEAGSIDEREFWSKFSQKYNIDLSKHKVSPWLKYYQNIMIINQPLLKFVRSLKSQGYKVAILSNTDAAAVKCLKNLKIVDEFDVVVFSCEVGVLKPDKRIYKLALEKLDVRPGEVVFIDDQERWVKASRKLGIHGIVFRGLKDLQEKMKVFLLNS